MKFVFAGHYLSLHESEEDNLGALFLVTIDDKKHPSTRTNIEVNDSEKARAEFKAALLDHENGNSVFVDLRCEDLDFQKLETKHFYKMAMLYHERLIISPDANKKIGSYLYAFAMSVCYPDTYFLHHRKAYPNGDYIGSSISMHSTIEDAINARKASSKDWITNSGGDTYRNGELIAYIDAVGNVFNDTPFSGRKTFLLDINSL